MEVHSRSREYTMDWEITLNGEKMREENMTLMLKADEAWVGGGDWEVKGHHLLII